MYGVRVLLLTGYLIGVLTLAACTVVASGEAEALKRWQKSELQGLAARRAGDLKLAAECYAQAASTANAFTSPQWRRSLAHSLKNLGDAYASLGKTAEALKAYQDCIAIWRERSFPFQPTEAMEYSRALLALAHVLAQEKEYSLAEQKYQQARALKSTDARVNQRLSEMANAAIMQYLKGVGNGRQPQFLTSEESVQDHRSANNKQIIAEWERSFSAGTKACAHGKLPLAQEQLSKALRAALSLDIGSERTSQTAERLSMVYESVGNLQDAVNTYRVLSQSLAASIKHTQDQNLQQRQSLRLAEVYFKMGSLMVLQREYSQAQDILEQSLTIREQILGPQDITVARILLQLGSVLEAQNNIDAARRAYERAQDIARDKNDGYLLAASARALGELALRSGLVPEAIARLTDSVHFFEKSGYKNTPEHAWALNFLTEAYMRSAQYSKALPLARSVVQIVRSATGTGYPDLAGVTIHIPDILYCQQDYAGAKKAYTNLLKSLRGTNSDPKFIGSLLFKIGVCSYRTGEYKLASRMFERSRHLKHTAGVAESDPELVQMRELLPVVRGRASAAP